VTRLEWLALGLLGERPRRVSLSLKPG